MTKKQNCRKCETEFDLNDSLVGDIEGICQDCWEEEVHQGNNRYIKKIMTKKIKKIKGIKGFDKLNNAETDLNYL